MPFYKFTKSKPKDAVYRNGRYYTSKASYEPGTSVYGEKGYYKHTFKK